MKRGFSFLLSFVVVLLIFIDGFVVLGEEPVEVASEAPVVVEEVAEAPVVEAPVVEATIGETPVEVVGDGAGDVTEVLLDDPVAVEDVTSVASDATSGVSEGTSEVATEVTTGGTEASEAETTVETLDGSEGTSEVTSGVTGETSVGGTEIDEEKKKVEKERKIPNVYGGEGYWGFLKSVYSWDVLSEFKIELREVSSLDVMSATSQDVSLSMSVIVGWNKPSNFDGVLVIPPGISGIAEGVFRDCGIVEVELPRSLRFIEDYAFADNKIERVTVHGVEYEDEDGSFIDFPSHFNYIGEGAFSNNRLGSVVGLLGEVRFVGDFAFSDNKIMDEVNNNAMPIR